jgi:hypothetical protein
MRIAFVWTNGVKDKYVFDRWNDGLRAAMRIIETEHEVTYHEPYEDLPTVDWVLFWEAPCTHDSPEWGQSFRKVKYSPQKKALLFAGGPIKKEWVDNFDHVFVESKVNKDEFDRLGVRNSTAFGVNTEVFKPMDEIKVFRTETHGTCAAWKRQWLAGEAFGEMALVFGRDQKEDPRGFQVCREMGSRVLLEQSYPETARLINTAKVGLNLADAWGGGQRATLEAMACGLPVVVMNDSPKNCEFIEDGGMGVMTNPIVCDIQTAVAEAEKMEAQEHNRDYVLSKWSEAHYAIELLNGISK